MGDGIQDGAVRVGVGVGDAGPDLFCFGFLGCILVDQSSISGLVLPLKEHQVPRSDECC